MASLEKATGTIRQIEPARTFIDGELFRRMEILTPNGESLRFEMVFFTLRLCPLAKPKVSGTFYFWNSHCYAANVDGQLQDDIDGARSSYFRRDAKLLLLMALSILLLPVSLFIAGKKLVHAGSAEEMRAFLAS